VETKLARFENLVLVSGLHREVGFGRFCLFGRFHFEFWFWVSVLAFDD